MIFTSDPKLQERINHIKKEISGAVGQSNITSWELKFINNLQEDRINFGSQKQLAIMDRIETKVFGTVQNNEDIKKGLGIL